MRPAVVGLGFSLGALFLCPSQALGQRGAILHRQNLAELADEATTIVRGRVLRAKVEPHPHLENLRTVAVTLQVEEVLKGEAGATLRFRQFIWDVRDSRDAAGYQKGQHLLLLLTKPSRYGLSVPAGLQQGRFHLRRDDRGQLQAVNGFHNLGLFTHLEERDPTIKQRLRPAAHQLLASHRAGPIAYEQLAELIRAVLSKETE